MSKNYIYALLACLVIGGVVVGFMRHKKKTALSNVIVDQPNACHTKATCGGDEACLCYCSVKCGFREKTDEDRPVVKEGVCFCKDWDYDNFKNRKCDKKPQQK